MNIQDTQEQAKHVLDAALGTGAISSPVWLQYFTLTGNIVLILGGIALLAIRIALARREWIKGKTPSNDS